jgi:[ribosomal protein S18]-alanine N-acetyltransferase
VILRAATGADAVGVAALERELFGADAWSLASVVTELSGDDRFAVVAVADAELLGYAVTMRAGDVVDLQRIGVRGSRRREGVASALLGAALERAAVDGARRMLLEVSTGNQPAIEFYAVEGFVEIDRRPRYYRDGSDALVLGRSLDRPARPGPDGVDGAG